MIQNICKHCFPMEQVRELFAKTLKNVVRQRIGLPKSINQEAKRVKRIGKKELLTFIDNRMNAQKLCYVRQQPMIWQVLIRYIVNKIRARQ